MIIKVTAISGANVLVNLDQVRNIYERKVDGDFKSSLIEFVDQGGDNTLSICETATEIEALINKHSK